MCFQPVVLQLGPILFQVVGQAQQKQLQGDIRPSSREEAFKLAVAFQNTKGALYLNRTIHPKQRASVRGQLPVSLCSALCKLLANFDFFAEVGIPGLCTLFPQRAASASLAAVIAASGNYSVLFL